MKKSAYVIFGKTGVTIFEFDISLERPSGFVVCLLRCRYCIIWIGSNRTIATKIGHRQERRLYSFPRHQSFEIMKGKRGIYLVQAKTCKQYKA